jgi:sialate O-acetylesterase
MDYRILFPAMIRDWRRTFHQADLAFLFVQLANYLPAQQEPVEQGSWAELREAQSLTLREPGTGMAMAIDIGDADDIHPRNKQDVGNRLALSALAQVYGKDIVFSGPIYRSHEIEGNSVRLHFDHAVGLKTCDGSAPKGFAIAGSEGVFHWAEARIDGDSVVVHSSAVSKPVAVRYGWANNPPVNLYNGAGLPASPFRTDA